MLELTNMVSVAKMKMISMDASPHRAHGDEFWPAYDWLLGS